MLEQKVNSFSLFTFSSLSWFYRYLYQPSSVTSLLTAFSMKTIYFHLVSCLLSCLICCIHPVTLQFIFVFTDILSKYINLIEAFTAQIAPGMRWKLNQAVDTCFYLPYLSYQIIFLCLIEVESYLPMAIGRNLWLFGGHYLYKHIPGSSF